MGLRTRHILDKTFTVLAGASVALLSIVLLLILGPMILKGSSAVFFHGTVEFRKMQRDLFERGDLETLTAERKHTDDVRAVVYETIETFRKSIQIDVETLVMFERNARIIILSVNVGVYRLIYNSWEGPKS